MGCAFAACLERKQRREKECGVTAAFDASRTSFAREGSFRLSGGGRPAEREAPEKKKGGCCPEDRAGPRVGPPVCGWGTGDPVWGESGRGTGTLQFTKQSASLKVRSGFRELASSAMFCRPQTPAELASAALSASSGRFGGGSNGVSGPVSGW